MKLKSLEDVRFSLEDNEVVFSMDFYEDDRGIITIICRDEDDKKYIFSFSADESIDKIHKHIVKYFDERE